jgi:hypothetical protein
MALSIEHQQELRKDYPSSPKRRQYLFVLPVRLCHHPPPILCRRRLNSAVQRSSIVKISSPPPMQEATQSAAVRSRGLEVNHLAQRLTVRSPRRICSRIRPAGFPSGPVKPSCLKVSSMGLVARLHATKNESGVRAAAREADCSAAAQRWFTLSRAAGPNSKYRFPATMFRMQVRA